MCSWNNEHPGVVPRVQSMSVHSVLARCHLELFVVHSLLGGVRWPTENSSSSNILDHLTYWTESQEHVGRNKSQKDGSNSLDTCLKRESTTSSEDG